MEFTITEDWLSTHRTKRGAYNKHQIKVLGVNWPLVRGWKREVIGRQISFKEKMEFESYSSGGRAYSDWQKAWGMVKRLNHRDQKLIYKMLNQELEDKSSRVKQRG